MARIALFSYAIFESNCPQPLVDKNNCMFLICHLFDLSEVKTICSVLSYLFQSKLIKKGLISEMKLQVQCGSVRFSRVKVKKMNIDKGVN